jgi:hypothetical protein
MYEMETTKYNYNVNIWLKRLVSVQVGAMVGLKAVAITARPSTNNDCFTMISGFCAVMGFSDVCGRHRLLTDTSRWAV